MVHDISPFYPGRPVPLELFVGRQSEIRHIIRAAKQVASGKQENIFITGEFGIGKSSLAAYVKFLAEKETNLVGFHVLLGGATTLEKMSEVVMARIVQETQKEGLFDNLKDYLGRYVKEVDLFGVTLDVDALKSDARAVAHNFLPFLRNVYRKLEPRCKGIMLILDDINGITANKEFAALLKSTVDEIATSRDPLPLLLILSGVPERRDDILKHQRSVERIFEIVEIAPLDNEAVREFFIKSFDSVNMKITPKALEFLVHNSGGLPKLMHELGDATFWACQSETVDENDAFHGTIIAAGNVGRKYFQPVYNALRSTDYHSILKKISRLPGDLSFKKADAVKGLSDREKRKFDNFLQRMKSLHVLRPGDSRGEWVFPNRLIRIYLILASLEKGSS